MNNQQLPAMQGALRVVGLLILLCPSCTRADGPPFLDFSRYDHLPLGWCRGENDLFDTTGGVLLTPDRAKIYYYYFDGGGAYSHPPFGTIEWLREEDYSTLDASVRHALPGDLGHIQQYRIEGYKSGRVDVIILASEGFCIRFTLPRMSRIHEEEVLPVILLFWDELISLPK